MFATHLDRRIFQAIRASSADSPQTLPGIIGHVDACEKLILTREELANGLERLIAAGQIMEISPNVYCPHGASTQRRTFTGLPKADYDRAVAEYRRESREALTTGESKAGAFVQRRVVVRLATRGGRWPTDADEDAAEDFAKLTSPLVDESGLGEINGFEFGRGYIDVLIFGRESRDDSGRLRDLIAPQFRTWNTLSGSRILRYPGCNQTPVESDRVP